MRLINADALIDSLNIRSVTYNCIINKCIEDAPTIEVVRCKDCRHSRVYGKTTQWLACENVVEGQATDPDGYCYLGERREP